MKRINKMMQSILWLCVACFTLLVGCIHDDLSASASVDYKVISIDAQANNVLYTITSNTDWEISSNQEWCTPTPESGTGTTDINIIIDANPLSEERTGDLTLTCGGSTISIEVIQAGLVETLQVSPAEYSVDNKSQIVSVAVMANTSWYATSSTDGTDNDWLKLSKSEGENNGFINVDIDENMTYKDRSATITIYSENDNEAGLVQTVTINQLSQGLPQLILSQKSVFFSNALQSKYVTYVSNIEDIRATSDFAWCKASIENNMIKLEVPVNTAVLSRTATVTVVGVVDGQTVTSQILVSQEGMGSPSITLINDYLSIGYEGIDNASFSWIVHNGSKVSLGNKSSWIDVSMSSSPNSIVASIGKNEAEESRVGFIELIASNSAGEQTFYYITVSQSGVGAPSLIATPSSVSVGAKAGSGSVFVVVDNNAVTGASATTSSSWLQNVQVSPNAGKEYTVSYDYLENDSDVSRSGLITMQFKVGSQSYLHTISVIQAGLGSPALSTLDNIFMQSDQEDHEQNIWMMSGDKTNVTYEVIAQSYSTAAPGASGSVEAEEWILNGDDKTYVDDNHVLHVKALKNTESVERYGEITVIATRDDASTVLRINVVQGAHAGAGISGLTQEKFVDWEGGKQTLYFSALNNSKVEVVEKSTPSWIKEAVVGNIDSDDSGAYNPDNASGDEEGSYDKRLLFYVDEYNGGEKGSFREGIITLKVDNGNSNAIYYDVKVCQYEPAAAMAAIPDEVYVTFQKHEAYSMDINLQNNAKIVKVVIEDGADTWLSLDKEYAKLADGVNYGKGVENFTYTINFFDGGSADSRVANLYITVQNNNANTMTYTVKVTQGSPVEAIADVPSEIYVGFENNYYTFDINSKSGVNQYKASVLSNENGYNDDVDWLTVTPEGLTDVETGETPSVGFWVKNFDGEEGENRTAVIAVTVSGNHANDQTYYVNVIQGTPAENTINVPEYLEFLYEGVSNKVIRIENSGSDIYNTDYNVKMAWDDDWVSFKDSEWEDVSPMGGKVTTGDDDFIKLYLTVDEFEDSTEAFREQLVTFTASGANYRPVVAYTRIRQLSQEGAGATADDILLNYEATSDADITDITGENYTFDEKDWIVVAPNLINGSEISSVKVTSENSDWLTVMTVDDTTDKFYYYASENTTGETRYATITYQVKNNNTDVTEYYIKVTQTSSTYTFETDIKSIEASATGIGELDPSSGAYENFGTTEMTYYHNGVLIEPYDDADGATNDEFYENYYYSIDVAFGVDWIKLLDQSGKPLSDKYIATRNPGWGFQYAVEQNNTDQMRKAYITLNLHDVRNDEIVATKNILVTQAADTPYSFEADIESIEASATGLGEFEGGKYVNFGTTKLKYYHNGVQIAPYNDATGADNDEFYDNYHYEILIEGKVDWITPLNIDGSAIDEDGLASRKTKFGFHYYIAPNPTNQMRKAYIKLNLYENGTDKFVASENIVVTQAVNTPYSFEADIESIEASATGLGEFEGGEYFNFGTTNLKYYKNEVQIAPYNDATGAVNDEFYGDFHYEIQIEGKVDWITPLNIDGSAIDEDGLASRKTKFGFHYYIAPNPTNQVRKTYIKLNLYENKTNNFVASENILVSQAASTPYSIETDIESIEASATGLGEYDAANKKYENFGTTEMKYYRNGILISSSDDFFDTYTYSVEVANQANWIKLLDLNGEALQTIDNRKPGWGIQYAVESNSTDQMRKGYITLNLQDENGVIVATKNILVSQAAGGDYLMNIPSSFKIAAKGNLNAATVDAKGYVYNADKSYGLDFDASNGNIGDLAITATPAAEDGYIKVEALYEAKEWLFPATSVSGIDYAYAAVSNGNATLYVNARANLTGEERSGQLKLTAVSADGASKSYFVDVIQPAYDLGLTTVPFAEFASKTMGGAYGAVELKFNSTAASATAELGRVDTRAIADEDWIALVSKADYDSYVPFVTAYETAADAYEADNSEENLTAMETALAKVAAKFKEIYDAAAADNFEIDMASRKLYYICDAPGVNERTATIKVTAKDASDYTSNVQTFEVTQLAKALISAAPEDLTCNTVRSYSN